MASAIKTYPTPDAAEQAVEGLLTARVHAGHIRLLASQPLRDGSSAARGTFAGPVGPDAQIGAFAGPPRRLGQTRGSFATGIRRDEPERRRKGSFADVERVVIVTYGEAGRRVRATGYRGIRLLLRRSALDEHAVNQTVKMLHNGHSVVLVDADRLPPSEAHARFERAPQAA